MRGRERARDVCLWKCKETKLIFFLKQSFIKGSDVDELQKPHNILDHNICSKSASLS